MSDFFEEKLEKLEVYSAFERKNFVCWAGVRKTDFYVYQRLTARKLSKDFRNLFDFFRTLRQKFSTALSKLHSTCPEEHFWFFWKPDHVYAEFAKA